MEKEIKDLSIFNNLSNQFYKQNNLLIAFYMKLYAIEKATEISQKYKAQGEDTTVLVQQMTNWMQEGKQMKQTNPQMFENKDKNKQEIIDYIMKMFFICDNQEREDTYTDKTVKNFQNVSRMIEMTGRFGQIPQDLQQKKIYSKKKAIEMHKKLLNPELYPRKNQQNDQDEMQELEKQLNSQGLNTNTNQQQMTPQGYNIPQNQTNYEEMLRQPDSHNLQPNPMYESNKQTPGQNYNQQFYQQPQQPSQNQYQQPQQNFPPQQPPQQYQPPQQQQPPQQPPQQYQPPQQQPQTFQQPQVINTGNKNAMQIKLDAQKLATQAKNMVESKNYPKAMELLQQSIQLLSQIE